MIKGHPLPKWLPVILCTMTTASANSAILKGTATRSSLNGTDTHVPNDDPHQNETDRSAQKKSLCEGHFSS